MLGGYLQNLRKSLTFRPTVHAGEHEKDFQAPFEPLSLCKISSTIIWHSPKSLDTFHSAV